jgi:TIR domain-containing protein
MSDIQIFLVPNDDTSSPDLAWTEDLKTELDNEIKSRKTAVPVEVVVAPGFAKLPSIDQLGPLSVVVLVLPETSRGFAPEEKEAISAFQQSRSRGDIRLVPLSRDAGRDVPSSPLDKFVSQKIHDPRQTDDLKRLTNFLLNLIGLRLGGAQRKVFISYRMLDGKDWAARLANALKERGYDVWRDELADRDGQPFIGPGTEAQETIERAILDHGFVLVVDTREAPQSTWVHAEVDIAYAHMLPILPVVIEDNVNTAGQASIPIGGRFQVLKEMQRQVRITISDQGGKTVEQVINTQFMDRLEREMSEVVLGQLRSRMSLLREARSRFENLTFDWREVSPQSLLYEAMLNWDRAQSPRLALRLLIQCAPYDVLQEDQIINLMGHMAILSKHCQYGILVHPTATNPGDKSRLLRQSQGHLLLLTPDEIASLPQLLKI